MRRGFIDRKSEEMPPDDELESSGDPGLCRIIGLARAEGCWILCGLMALFVGTWPILVLPLFFGKVVDDIQMDASPEARRSAVTKHLIHLICILAVSFIASTARGFIFNGAGERVVARIRVQLFRAILVQEIGMFDKRKTGELLSRLTSDTTNLQDVATSNISMFFRGMTQIIFSVVLMFFTSWKLALVIVLVVPLCILAVATYLPILKRLNTEYTDILAASNDVAQQTLANVRTVRSFAAEDIESMKYENAIGNPDDSTPGNWLCCWYPRNMSALKAGIRRQVAASFFGAFVMFVFLGALVAVMWFGAYCVIQGELSFGDLTVFILYAVQIAASLGMIVGLTTSLYQAKGASKRTFQLIDRKPQIPVSDGLTPEIRGELCFEAVSFAYPTRREISVLKDFSLTIPKDATVAFVGSSGAGKSTILLLLQRFYDVTEGRILIDNVPLTTLDPSWLRRHFALVQQEPVLFGATIEANIAYGYAVREGLDAVPTREQLEAVARAAHAHEFVSDFPEGYQTFVGERGVRLSGGQKQRLAIARALLMNPRVLLLDEATSALDAESEAAVQRAIEEAMVGRTTLLVAHRLSTVRSATEIVVVEGGSIVSMAPHEQLLEQCAKYRDLVSRQLLDGTSAPAAIPSADANDSVLAEYMSAPAGASLVSLQPMGDR